MKNCNYDDYDKIKEKVNEIWDNGCNIEIPTLNESKVSLILSKSYSYVECTFRQLEQLSLFFDTKNIDWENGFHSEGCSTCGSGSSYEIEITIYK